MAIFKMRLTTIEDINPYWAANQSIDELYRAKPEDGSAWYAADVTFSFPRHAVRRQPVRIFKLMNDVDVIHGCIILRVKDYQGYKIAIIENFAVDAVPVWRAFGVAAVERLVKYSKANHYHVVVAWGRTTDYYTNFGFDLIKPYIGMSALRLRSTDLTDDDLVAAAGYFGGATTTSSTTTTTTSSTASTTSTISTTSSTASTLSTTSTSTSTVSTTTSTTVDGGP